MIPAIAEVEKNIKTVTRNLLKKTKKIWIYFIGIITLAGIIFAIYTVLSSDNIKSPPPGKVWSPEHGHWHDAPGN